MVGGEGLDGSGLIGDEGFDRGGYGGEKERNLALVSELSGLSIQQDVEGGGFAAPGGLVKGGGAAPRGDALSEGIEANSKVVSDLGLYWVRFQVGVVPRNGVVVAMERRDGVVARSFSLPALVVGTCAIVGFPCDGGGNSDGGLLGVGKKMVGEMVACGGCEGGVGEKFYVPSGSGKGGIDVIGVALEMRVVALLFVGLWPDDGRVNMFGWHPMWKKRKKIMLRKEEECVSVNMKKSLVGSVTLSIQASRRDDTPARLGE